MYTVSKGTTPTSESIKKALDYAKERNEGLVKLDEYYNGIHEIVKRSKSIGLKNNKVVVNHARYITDICVGYLLGNPVDYRSESSDLKGIKDRYKQQNIAALDYKIAKDLSKFGIAYEYSFINEQTEIATKRVKPTNCIVVYDDTMQHNKLFAIMFDDVKGTKYINVTTVTDKEVQNWTQDLNPKGPAKPHVFKTVPVVEYVNNQEEMGDYEQVLTLINAYNTIQSDRVNDKEQLVEAILIFYGFGLEDDQKDDIKEHRMMSVPLPPEGTMPKAEYLTKQLNEADIETLKASIENDIHKISMTPNMSDENFVGNASGVAIKYKLMPFSILINSKEREFEKGLKERFQLYKTAMPKTRGEIKSESAEAYEVEVVFTHSLPQNDFETSQMIANLKDSVSQETLLTQLSFIDDAAAEAKKAAEERQKRIEQMVGQFGTDQPTDNSNDDDKSDE